MAFEITEENYQESIDNNDVVLIDVWANWCGPCKMLGPIIDEIASENTNENVLIAKADADEIPDLVSKLKVMSIPTVFVYKNGEQVNKLVGVKSKKEYLDAINSQL